MNRAHVLLKTVIALLLIAQTISCSTAPPQIKPVAGGFGGKLTGTDTFSLLFIILDNQSDTIDSVNLICAPGGRLNNLPITLAENVKIANGKFKVEHTQVVVEGEFLTPTQISGTIHALDANVSECGIPSDGTWRAECRMKVDKFPALSATPGSLITTSAVTAANGQSLKSFEVDGKFTAKEVESCIQPQSIGTSQATPLYTAPASQGSTTGSDNSAIPTLDPSLLALLPTSLSTLPAFGTPGADQTGTPNPAAAKAQIEVVEVISPGDITAEGVVMRNVSGDVIPLTNWTVSNSNGLKFTFPDYRMFPGGRVTIYTRTGTDTPVVLFWGQSHAVWGDPGEQATISDDKGVIQMSYPVANVPPASSSSSNVPVLTPTTGA